MAQGFEEQEDFERDQLQHFMEGVIGSAAAIFGVSFRKYSLIFNRCILNPTFPFFISRP